MSWMNKNPVKRIIFEANGDQAQIQHRIAEATESNPFFPLAHKTSREFLRHEQMVTAIQRVLLHERPEKYLQYIPFFRQHLQDEHLQSHLVNIHAKQPWQFYTHGEHVQGLFPRLYFNALLNQGKDFLADANLGPIFLLYYSHNQLASWNDEMRKYLRQHIAGQEVAQVRILDPKDAGFACGGMEKNYRQAARNDTGLCEVNGGLLLAKLYHAKESVEAKKVAYICRETRETSSEQILWNNYLYAPAEGQHQLLIDAISRGDRKIEIWDLKIRPIRPLIGETSKSIYSRFNHNEPPMRT